MEVVQYSGGIASVLWRDSFRTVEMAQYSGDNISTCRGITSVLWGITSVLWRVFSTAEGYLQYCGGITAVHVGDSFNTVGGYLQYCGGCSVQWGDSFSTVEGIQYIGGITSVHAGGSHQYMQGDHISTCGGITSVQWGITSVLWRVFSRVGQEF